MNRRSLFAGLFKAAVAGALSSATRFLPMPLQPRYNRLTFTFTHESHWPPAFDAELRWLANAMFDEAVHQAWLNHLADHKREIEDGR